MHCHFLHALARNVGVLLIVASCSLLGFLWSGAYLCFLVASLVEMGSFA